MPDEDELEIPTARSQQARPLLITIGVILILLSGFFFFTMLAVPWFPLTLTQKGLVGGGLYALAQVSWWVGVAMVGPTAINRIKQKFSKK